VNNVVYLWFCKPLRPASGLTPAKIFADRRSRYLRLWL
jgi:hypothetical protein